MSNAVSRKPWDSATIRVPPSGVIAMPLPKAIPSATGRAPEAATSAIVPGAGGPPALGSKPPPLT